MRSALTGTVRFRRFRLRSRDRQLERAGGIGDLRLMAQRRLPTGVFDYIDGGAEDELTLRRNVTAFDEYDFIPRVLNDVSQIDTSTTLLGTPLAFPFVLAPTGFTRIADAQGELAVARAAQRAGLPYTLSTLATRSIEEISAVSNGRRWFQVYVWRDRGLVTEMINRAADAGFEAIVPCVDLATFGRRERDVRNGFTLPPKIGIGTVLDGLRHPAWTANFLRGGPIRFANVSEADPNGERDGSSAVELADYANEQLDPSLTWDDIEWLRSLWNGPFVLKGIQSVADARIAADLGIDAICLSNHGGRQLEGSPAPVSLLPTVVDAVGGRTEIICDGGIRRGADIARAVALGANAVMGGRAYLYGLGAAGERGVDTALGFLADELRRTMALNGVTTIDTITRDMVAPRVRPTR